MEEGLIRWLAWIFTLTRYGDDSNVIAESSTTLIIETTLLIATVIPTFSVTGTPVRVAGFWFGRFRRRRAFPVTGTRSYNADRLTRSLPTRMHWSTPLYAIAPTFTQILTTWSPLHHTHHWSHCNSNHHWKPLTTLRNQKHFPIWKWDHFALPFFLGNQTERDLPWSNIHRRRKTEASKAFDIWWEFIMPMWRGLCV